MLLLIGLLLAAVLLAAAPAALAGSNTWVDLAVQQAELAGENSTAMDFFGWSVAIDGDTAVVAADLKNIGTSPTRGAVYVFTRSAGVWTEQTMLTAGDGADYDCFGSDVAIDGDTILVGAMNKTIDDSPNRGAAYIFVGSGPTWEQQDVLTAADGRDGDNFGYSVALSGDTALIGSPYHQVGDNSSQGVAYVFTRSGGAWTRQAELVASNGASNDYFGLAVALEAGTALVGTAYKTVDGKACAGSAYVFTGSGSSWDEQAILSPADAAAADYFGFSVAISGDTALVGAEYKQVGDNGGQGAAYVFTRGGSDWTQQAKLVAGDGAAGDQFGNSVALEGGTAVVGAYYAGGGQGAAYVFTADGASWSQFQKLTDADPVTNEHFGSSTAISGNTAVVGAFNKKVGDNIAQGAACVFVSGSGGPVAGFANALACGQGYLSAPNTSSIAFSGASDFTIELWVKPSGVATDGGHTLVRQRGHDWYDPDTLQSWLFLGKGNTLQFGFDKLGTGWYWSPVSVKRLPAGHWSHLAWVKSGTGVSLYVNGVKAINGDITGYPAETANADPAAFTFGGDAVDQPGGNHFAGDIDEVMIYDRALTETDVADAYNRGLGQSLPLDPATGPVRYYRLDEASGTTAADSGSDGTDATLTDMAASPWIESTAGRDVFSPGGGAVPFGVAYGDASTAGLTVAVVDQPAHGIIDLSSPSRGQGSYTPDSGWTGTESFTYTVSDGSTTTSPRTGTVTSGGTTLTYIGEEGGNWSVASNWDLDRAPQDGDNVVVYSSVDDIDGLELGDVTVVPHILEFMNQSVNAAYGVSLTVDGVLDLDLPAAASGWNVPTVLGPQASVHCTGSGYVDAPLSGGDALGAVPFSGSGLSLRASGSANTYAGGTFVAGGQVNMYDDALPAGSAVSIADGAILGLNVTGATAPHSYDSVFVGNRAAILAVVGDVAELTADSTSFQGFVTIQSTLRVSGSLGGSVGLQGGAKLTGTGAVNDLAVTPGGTVDPGPGIGKIGTLTATGDLDLVSSGALAVDMDSATGGAGSSPGWDQLVVGGDLIVDATSDEPFTVELVSVGDVSDFDPAQSYRWSICPYQGEVSGMDLASFTVDASAFTPDQTPTGTFSIGYADGELLLRYAPSGGPDTHTWSGDGGTKSWLLGGNWVEGTAPTSGDSLVFPAGVTEKNPMNDIEDLTIADVTIAEDGYDIAGTALTLSGTLAKTTGAGTSAWHPITTLTSTTHFRADEGELEMWGPMGGAADFVLDAPAGSGVFVLCEAATFTGDAELSGTLRLGALELLPHGAGYGDVDVAAGGVLDLDGFTQTLNGLSGAGFVGNVDPSSGDNALTVGDGDATSTFSGRLGRTSAGVPADRFRLVKIGVGTFTLDGEPGGWKLDTWIDAGALALGAADLMPHGEQADRVIVDDDGTLDLAGFDETVNGIEGSGIVTSSASTPAVLTLDPPNQDERDFSGTITDSGAGDGTLALVKNGDNLVQFDGTCDYRGGTTVTGGRLSIFNGAAQPAGGDVTVTRSDPGDVASTAYEFSVPQVTIGDLAGDGLVEYVGADDGELVLGSDGDSEFSGVIQDVNASAPMALTKQGTGTLTLSGASTYTGATAVDEGTLLVSGSLGAGSAVTVAAGATLGGSGAVDGSVDAFGILSPGSSPGTLATGAETWEPGGSYTVEMDDASGDPGVSPGWDLLDSAGKLTIASTSGEPFTVALYSDGQSLGFDESESYSWKIAGFAGNVDPIDPAVITIDTSGFEPLPGNPERFSLSAAEGSVFLEYAPATPTPGTLTFTNEAGGNWSVGSNWDANRAPIDGDSLVLWSSTDDMPGLQVQDVTVHNKPGESEPVISAADGVTLAVDGELSFDGYNQVWNVPLSVGAGTTVSANGWARLDAPVSGGDAAGTLTLTGEPTQTFTLDLLGAGSWAGATAVTGGKVAFADGALPAGSPVSVADGATAQLGDGNGSAAWDNAFSGPPGARLVTNASDTTLSGDSGGFTGTLHISTLTVVTGNILGTVTGGGHLAGSGSVGAIAPDPDGYAPLVWPSMREGIDFAVSTLSATSWLPSTEGTPVLACGISDASGAAGSGYDQLHVTGDADFSAAAGLYVIPASYDASGSFGECAGFDPTQSYTWEFMRVDGAVTGFDPALVTVFDMYFLNAHAGGTFTAQLTEHSAYKISLAGAGKTTPSSYSTIDIVYTPRPTTLTWQGSDTDDNWSTAANWVEGTVPQDGDSLVFPDGASKLDPVNDLTDLSLEQVTIGAPSYDITGNAVSLEATMTCSPGTGVSRWELPTTLGAAAPAVGVTSGTLVFTGAGTLDAGTGAFTKDGEGALQLEAAATFGTGVEVAAGQLTASVPAAVPASSGIAVADGATFTCDFMDRGAATLTGALTGPAGAALHVGQWTTLALAGDASGFTGSADVAGVFPEVGVLRVADGVTFGGAPAGSGAVSGDGAIAGFGTVGYLFPGITGWQQVFGSFYMPSLAVSVLKSASTTWEDGTSLGITMTDAAGEAGVGHDQVLVTGDLTIADGATVAVGPISSAGGTMGECQDFDPSAAYRWHVVRVSGTISGFDQATKTVVPDYFLNACDGDFSLEQGTVEAGGKTTPASYATIDLVYTPAAGTRTWTGAAGDHLWSTAGNWDAGVPASGDSLVFPAGAADLAPENDLSGLELAAVALEAGGYAVSGEAVALTGALESTGTSSWALATTLPAAGAIASAEGTLTVAGALGGGDGAGTLTKAGPGELVLAAANGYAGATAVAAGTLTLAAAGALPAGSQTAVAAGAELVFDVPGPESYDNVFSGAGTLRVTPGGTVTISSASPSFTGAALTAGALVVTGSLPAPVSGSGVVGGSGSVESLAAGTLVAWPGLTEEAGAGTEASPATLTAGSLSCLPRARFAVTVADPEGAAGAGYDQLTSDAAVELGGAALQVAPQTVTAEGLLGPTGLFDETAPYRWQFLRAPAVNGFDPAAAQVAASAFADPTAGRFTVERTQHAGYVTLDLVYTPFLGFAAPPTVGSGAAKLPANTVQRIAWEMAGPATGGTFDVLLTDGAKKTTTLASGISADGSAAYHYDWAAGAAAANLTVKVVYHGPAGDETSAPSAAFALTPPTATVTAPVSGTVRKSQETSVTWTMDVPVATGSFKLYLQKAGTTTLTLLTPTALPAVPGQSAYAWAWKVAQAPAVYTLWVYYYSAAGTLVSRAAGAGSFELLPPPALTVTAPVSGSVRKTSETTATWTIDPGVTGGSFKLYAQKAGATALTLLTPAALPVSPGATAYAWRWTVALAPATYSLWVYYHDASGALVGKAQGGAFGVLGPPTPTVTAPVSGSVRKTSETTVTWTMDAPVSTGSFKLYAQKAGTTTLTLLTSTALPAVPGQSAYAWRWTVALAPATYTLWNYYYDAAGALVSKAQGGAFGVLAPPAPTVTAPLSGSFKKGTAETTVTWTMDALPTATGSFRLYLKTVSTGALTQLTATALPADAAKTSYSWKWKVTQPAGSYYLQVNYYAAGTTLASTGVAATAVTITP